MDPNVSTRCEKCQYTFSVDTCGYANYPKRCCAKVWLDRRGLPKDPKVLEQEDEMLKKI